MQPSLDSEKKDKIQLGGHVQGPANTKIWHIYSHISSFRVKDRRKMLSPFVTKES